MAKKDVAVMQPEAWMTNPSWFLVAGLAWPEDQADAGMAEAAFAVAPDVTQVIRPVGPDGKPVPLGRDLALMLDVGSRCAAELGKRVIFLSDITLDRKSTRLNSSHVEISYAVFCLKKK